MGVGFINGGGNGFEGMGSVGGMGSKEKATQIVDSGRKITSEGPILQDAATKKIYDVVRPRVFSPSSQQGVSSTTGTERRQNPKEVQQKVLKAFAAYLDNPNWKGLDIIEKDFKELHELLDELIDNSSSEAGGIGLGKVQKTVIRKEVISFYYSGIKDRAQSAVASRYVASDGDVGGKEQEAIHKLYELGGGALGTTSKKTIAEDSFKQFGMAMGKMEGTTDLAIIAAKLESKGIGQTLDTESKSRILENVSQELSVILGEPAKAEKETHVVTSSRVKPALSNNVRSPETIKTQADKLTQKKTESSESTSGMSSLADQAKIGDKQQDAAIKAKNAKIADEKLAADIASKKGG